MTSKSPASDRCGFESHQGLWICSWEEAILLAYGMLVVQLRWQFVIEIMHEQVPEVFQATSESWKVTIMTIIFNSVIVTKNPLTTTKIFHTIYKTWTFLFLLQSNLWIKATQGKESTSRGESEKDLSASLLIYS